MIKSRAGADCVIVALANYFGKDYETVLADVEAAKLHKEENYVKFGYVTGTYERVMEKYLGRVPQRRVPPRRGQEKVTGIARMARPNAKGGHLVAIIDGHVFDYRADGMPIQIYRRITGYNLKGVWQ